MAISLNPGDIGLNRDIADFIIFTIDTLTHVITMKR